jgi:outer membrane protein W
MKKSILLFTALVFGTLITSAQSIDYRPFRFGLGTGFALPAGDNAQGGILFYAEPSFRISDAIALGLRAELAAMALGTIDNTNVDLDVAWVASYTLNGQYYLSYRKFRPFVGGGLGIYSLASSHFDSNNGSSQGTDVISAGSKFGFYPRVGFDAGHFTMNVEYNVVSKTRTPNLTINNNYLAIKIGFFIGGGRR